MNFYESKASFAGGELSPALAARADLAAYTIGARELTNCLVLPQGGLINRPGTRVLDRGAEYASARLVPFVAGETNSFALAFLGDNTVEVYDAAGNFVHSIPGAPYTEEQLTGLRWLQSVDIMYLFHQRVPVYKLMRYADDDWRFQPAEFKNGPYQDINTDESRHMTLTGSTLTADFDAFTPDMPGSMVQLEYKAPSNSGDLRANTEAKEIMLFGDSTIATHGNWDSSWTVTIFRREPDGVYPSEPLRTWIGDGVNNEGYSVNESKYGVMYKILANKGTGGSGVRVTWSSGGGITHRQVKIDQITDVRAAAVTSGDLVLTDVPETLSWALGAFGENAGYPALGIFHQERLILCNTPSNPQTIWMSRPASWEDFGVTVPAEDTDSITVTLASRQFNEIRGLSSREDLLIFTSNAEWVAQAGRQGDVFSPSNVIIVPSAYRGSAKIETLDVGPSPLFVQEHGKIVRALSYQLEIDGYASSELSILSSHMTEGTRITRWTYQQEPWSVVWMVLENGEVLALTVHQEHQVNAWTRHRFSGPVKDVCCVPGEDQDEVFMLVGYGDASRLVTLNHRNDRPGAFAESDYLDDGTEPYTTAFESLELEQNVSGTLQGRHKRVAGAAMRLYRTARIKAGVINENNGRLDSVLNSGEPFTGDIYFRLPGGAAKQCRIRIENDHPGPLSVLGIFPEVSID